MPYKLRLTNVRRNLSPNLPYNLHGNLSGNLSGNSRPDNQSGNSPPDSLSHDQGKYRCATDAAYISLEHIFVCKKDLSISSFFIQWDF